MAARLVDYRNESEPEDHHEQSVEDQDSAQPLDTSTTDPHHPQPQSIPNEALSDRHDRSSNQTIEPNILPTEQDPRDDDKGSKKDEIDSDLLKKITRYKTLREQGIYFNDNLINSKSYRNPNIYAKLVEFLNVKETSTNFDLTFWDPLGFPANAYADSLREQQKSYSDEKQRSQSNGKRSNIEFERSNSTTASSSHSISHRYQSSEDQTNRKDRASEPGRHHHHHHHHNGDRYKRDREQTTSHPRRRDRSKSPRRK